jgi:hypothetical protein
MKYRVIKPHDAGNTEAFVVGKGEKLTWERKPTIWAGWLWCTASDGRQAWVPEPWVELRGESCVMLRDYSSRELCVREGESFDVELAESSWAWGRNSSGDYGWVPLDAIEPDSEDAI